MKTNMKTSVIGLLLVMMGVQGAFAQDSTAEQEIVDLSKDKWEWMADKNVDTLATFFDDRSKFVHMGGTWGKAEELEIIGSGRIHYKQADVHDVVVEVFGDTAIVWNRITLLAVVFNNEVTNEFTVTEVYKRAESGWSLLGLTFSSVRDGHTIGR